MKLRFLLVILLLTASNATANSRTASENGNLLQTQTLAMDFENENVKPFELVLLLGAMVFPITLICAHELCRSERVPTLPVGSFNPLRASIGSQASHDIGFFHWVDPKRIP